MDIDTLALNMYTKAVDPKLDFSNINKIKEVYERTTKMQVGYRQPYAGKLVFTAFSGSHQDAINKGEEYMKTSGTEYWEVPYLPIDPADVGREYEPIIRINSQSGKGGAAFIMSNVFGYQLPKAMHPEFGAAVKAVCDAAGTEISPQKVFEIFSENKVSVDLISTSEANISVTVDSSQNIDRVVKQLSEFADVIVDNDKSQISVIGKNIINLNGLLKNTFAPLRDCKIYMISQGASYVNISFVVDRTALNTVMQEIHHYLFEDTPEK